MLILALKTLRARKGAFVAAFGTLLVAATLITACGVLLQTGIAGGVPAERYRSADVVVAGAQSYVPQRLASQPSRPDPPTRQLRERVRLDAGLAGRIGAVPGVRTVVPDVSFPVTMPAPVAGPPVLGHGWDSARLTPFTLRAGHAPQQADEVVLDASLADRAGVHAGDRIALQVNADPVAYRVTGIVEPVGGELAKQSALFFTPQRATELAGTGGRVDAFGVIAEPGTAPDSLADRISQALPERGIVTRTGTDRGAVEFLSDGNSLVALIGLSASFGGIALMVALFVVSSTLALSVQQRQREMALLRAIGTTPQQLRRLVGGEALVLGLLASVLGCLPGFPVAQWLLTVFVDSHLVSPEVRLITGPLPALAAVASLVLAAVVAGLSAARRAARTRPTEALGEAAVQRTLIGRGRLITGLVLLAASAALLVVSSSLRGTASAGAASGVVLLLIVAVAVLGPVVAKLVGLVSAPVMRRFRVGGYLASANSVTNAIRLAGSITPLVLAIGFGCVAVFVQTTQLHATEQNAKASITADYVLTAPEGVPTSVVGEIGKVPGVSSATALRQTEVIREWRFGEEVGAEVVSAIAISPGDPGRTLDLGQQQGSLSQVRGKDIALSRQTAEDMGVHVGDQVRLRLGDGSPVQLRLVCTFDRELGLGKAVLDRTLVAGHTTRERDDQVLVRADRSALGVLTQRFPALSVTDGAAVRAASTDQLRANAWLNLLVVGMILLYTGIAVVNTLVMATSARTREFALLRLVGATRGQILRTTRWESALVVVSSVVLGTAVAAATLIPISLGLTGSPMPYAPPELYGGLVGVVAVMALLATEVPARIALRLRPVEAIGIKE
ncbi:ABC transporter permease [Kutzneria viridogrisea]|uniref:ABC transport system permease protein n=1 Tax=Kutzneria viridogrisea TaxID=47990 RepID=A0ABR6B8R4_9PSEU|nr:putative ABC transport system permease protein [Kutzneria viridogrisea]